MKTLTEINNWLKENLNEKRYLHSLGTAECAKDLAEKYNLDTEKAYLAGLTHDCAKCYKNEELNEILEKKMHCDMDVHILSAASESDKEHSSAFG